MAAEFLGGLGNFATSFMKGYEQAEDREAQLKQRQFEEGQRQRKLDEQRRADELRAADASVQTTEDVEVPGTKTIYGKEAPVVRDDEGNLMPGAVDTPAATVKRQRSWDAIYRDYAANRQKAGDTASALEFTDKANKVSAQRAANAFLQVQADASSKTPMQLAQEIGKIFDSDPMNGGTKSIEELPDGGVRMTLFNKDTGQTSTREFKGPKAREELLAAFTPYFRPDSYAKLLDKQSEIAAEIAKDPYKQVAGGYIDKRTGKFTATMVGQDVIGYNADGSPIYGSKGQGTGSGSSGSGSATGKGGKASDPLSAVSERVFDIIKESAAKGALEPGQVARANTLGRQLVASAISEGRNIDEGVASELAIGVATGKMPVTPAFNPRTGTIDNVVEYQGNKFAVENMGKPGSARLDDKQLSSVAVNYISSLPQDQRAQIVAAAYNQDALGKLNASLEQRARSPEAIAALEQRLGRKATEDDISKAVKATQDAVRPSLEMISRYATLSDEGKKITTGLAREAGYSSDFKSPTQQQQGRQTSIRNVGGMKVGSAVPQSAVDATNAQQAEERKRREAAQEADRQKAESVRKAKEEITGLTPAVINNIGDLKTAEDLYNRYNGQLDGFQREAFQRVISNLRTQARMSRYATPRQ